MAIIFTRELNRVDVDIDSGSRKHSFDPNLNVSGINGEGVIYLSVGPLDYSRSNAVLSFPVLKIPGRPNDSASDTAEWLSDDYFAGNNYLAGAPSGGTGAATEAKQDTQISEIQDVEAELINIKNKMKSADVSEVFDSKELVFYVGGGLDGKLSYVRYKTGGRFGTEVARRTLYYDGNNKLQYTEKT